MELLQHMWTGLAGLQWKLGGLTGFGSALLYARWSVARSGQVQMRALGFEFLLKYLPVAEGWKKFLAFLIFVLTGGIVGMVMAEPTSGRQAIAAGFGWTALLGSPTATEPGQTGSIPPKGAT